MVVCGCVVLCVVCVSWGMWGCECGRVCGWTCGCVWLCGFVCGICVVGYVGVCMWEGMWLDVWLCVGLCVVGLCECDVGLYVCVWLCVVWGVCGGVCVCVCVGLNTQQLSKQSCKIVVSTYCSLHTASGQEWPRFLKEQFI